MGTCRLRKRDRPGAVQLLEEVTNEFTDIIHVATVKETVIEKHLSRDERKAFDRDDAIAPWLDNNAWIAVKDSTVELLEKCPLQFFLK